MKIDDIFYRLRFIMKLIVDRFYEKKDTYTASLNADYDLSIYTFQIYIDTLGSMKSKSYRSKDELSEIDKIVTGITSLSWCLLHIKSEAVLNNPDLRKLINTRLKYKRTPVELIEFGKQLF